MPGSRHDTSPGSEGRFVEHGFLHVTDPEIGEKVSDYQKLFREIFGGK